MLRVSPSGCRLQVAFNDGVGRDVNRAFLLRGSLRERLPAPTYLRQVRVDDEARTVVWPNGLDPARSFCTATAGSSPRGPVLRQPAAALPGCSAACRSPASCS